MQINSISVDTLTSLLGDESVILIDTRPAAVFIPGFVPGSISMPLHSTYGSQYAGLVPTDATLLLITLPGEEDESADWLSSLGMPAVKGALEGGYLHWEKSGGARDMIIDIEPDELAMDMPHDDALLTVDVRSTPEYAEGHIAGAFSLPLSQMADPAQIAMLPETANLYLYCTEGLRSITAASMLKLHGMHQLRVVNADWESIRNTKGISTEKDATALN